MPSFSIIITAGGIGKRMGSEIPKQFIKVGDLPILMHAINCFYSFDAQCQIIVTLPNEWKSYWEELCKNYAFTCPHTLVIGGVERYDSIKNALSICTHDIIGIHDGVRPLVSADTIERCFTLAKEKGSAVPVLPLKESIRKVEGTGTKAMQRNEYFTVQTPQFFSEQIVKNAYKISFHSSITDDASLVEEAGYAIETTAGNEENIKVTTPYDLKIVELFL